jgi:sarcosine oxidase
MSGRPYDVIVIGLGGMGSAAACHLARRGQRVLGLERFGPAHDRGSSHGGSRIIRQAYFEDPAYVPLLLRAYELWEEAEQAAGDEIKTETGGLMLGAADSLTVAGSLRSAREWGLAHELLDAAQVRRRFPTLAPAADTVALYERRAGFIRPEASVAAHLRLANGHGAELRFDEPVLSWDAEGPGVRVVTRRGTYTADRLVICPGAWAPVVLASLRVPFVIERQVQFWFRPASSAEAFRADRHPIYIWETKDRHEDGRNVQFYGFPVHDGPGSGAKVASFRGGMTCSPDTIDRTVHPDEVERMRAIVAACIPSLAGTFLRAKTCMYTSTPDEHFVIAPHPEHPQVTVGCGFSGHGFKFVPVVGEILADLATTGTTRHPIDLFSPARFARSRDYTEVTRD